MRIDKKLKKKLILNAPYLLFVYLFGKVAQGFRLAPGIDASQKLLYLMDGFEMAFSSSLPSIHPMDLLVGIAGAVIMWLVVYTKGKNAKKFRKNMEYGSARWGNAEDIAPYMDENPWYNLILTNTEGLTMNSRPKDPKTARNKNVLVIGGSGSGKTRFCETQHYAVLLFQNKLPDKPCLYRSERDVDFGVRTPSGARRIQN